MGDKSYITRIGRIMYSDGVKTTWAKIVPEMPQYNVYTMNPFVPGSEISDS